MAQLSALVPVRDFAEPSEALSFLPLEDFSGASPSMVREVRSALARMYDPVHLQRHPLARRLIRAGTVATAAEAGAALRRTLLDAIDAIKPALRPASERGSRPYRIMQLRYLEALDPVEVQDQLGIAKTQYYRDHELALQAVAEHVGRALPAEDAPPHLRLVPPRASGAAAPERRMCLIPVSSLEDVERALAALPSTSGSPLPVFLLATWPN